MKSILVLLALSALLIGCDSESATGPSEQPTFLAAGSSFSFTRVSVDTFGNDISGFEQFHTDSVEAVNLTYRGKTRVMRVVTYDNGYPLEENYYNAESNGDLSHFLDNGSSGLGKSIWITLPVFSRGAKEVTFLDSTIIENGVEAHVTGIVKTSFISDGTMTLQDSTFRTVRVRMDMIFALTSSVENESFSVTSHYTFAPALGYFVDMRVDPIAFPDSPKLQGQHSWLTSYQIQKQ